MARSTWPAIESLTGTQVPSGSGSRAPIHSRKKPSSSATISRASSMAPPIDTLTRARQRIALDPRERRGKVAPPGSANDLGRAFVGLQHAPEHQRLLARAITAVAGCGKRPAVEDALDAVGAAPQV